MKFKKALKAMKEGKSVTRANWSDEWYVKLGVEFGELYFHKCGDDKVVDDCNMWWVEDIEADDWYIVEDEA